ncbi:MAG: hypothetical protein HZA46_12465 [Planctomycetales bacterium]|nr:hypothetical protein [Planctomycetales bacterium]
MKLASISFFVLLLFAHAKGGLSEMIEQPLSQFRDGEQRWLGYTLFALLVLIGLLYAVALARSRQEREAIVAGFAVLLLLFVVTTHSLGVFHLIGSLLLLGLLFGHFALLLFQAESLWLFAHLAVPVTLALVTLFQSYGIWQKGLVSYFVVAVMIHYSTLSQSRPVRDSSQFDPDSLMHSHAMKRQKVEQSKSEVWELVSLSEE